MDYRGIPSLWRVESPLSRMSLISRWRKPSSNHNKSGRCVRLANQAIAGEKPMCVSVKEANELVALQEKSPRLKVQVGFQRRCSPRTIEGVKLLRDHVLVQETTAHEFVVGERRADFSICA